MTEKKSSTKRRAEYDDDKDSGAIERMKSDRERYITQINRINKARDKEREDAFKAVQAHKKKFVEMFEGHNLNFQNSIKEAFLEFQQTESHFNVKAIEYLRLASQNVAAADTSLQNTLLYLDLRHGKEVSNQLLKAFKDFESTVAAHKQLLENIAVQDAFDERKK